MTFWLTALLVWMAAGARVGRVPVKPATTARVAIVVAVVAVAAAATVSIPEVGLALDNLLPHGIHGTMFGDRMTVAAWLLFTDATSVVAAAAWPVVSRRKSRPPVRGRDLSPGAPNGSPGGRTTHSAMCWSMRAGSRRLRG